MENFLLNYLVIYIIAFLISIFITRWIFRIDEIVDLLKENNKLLKNRWAPPVSQGNATFGEKTTQNGENSEIGAPVVILPEKEPEQEDESYLKVVFVFTSIAIFLFFLYYLYVPKK